MVIAAKMLLIEQGIPQEKLFVIHNSLDYDIQKAIRENIKTSSIYNDHFQNSSPTIIFIGRLTKVKKLDMIVGCSCTSSQQRRKVQYGICGRW